MSMKWIRKDLMFEITLIKGSKEGRINYGVW